MLKMVSGAIEQANLARFGCAGREDGFETCVTVSELIPTPLLGFDTLATNSFTTWVYTGTRLVLLFLFDIRIAIVATAFTVAPLVCCAGAASGSGDSKGIIPM
jgi:hypothetical protein